ncbi:hypothetical protein BC938DRAFT_473050, partial [Jimgerdemannia flammicorona]
MADLGLYALKIWDEKEFQKVANIDADVFKAYFALAPLWLEGFARIINEGVGGKNSATYNETVWEFQCSLDGVGAALSIATKHQNLGYGLGSQSTYVYKAIKYIIDLTVGVSYNPVQENGFADIVETGCFRVIFAIDDVNFPAPDCHEQVYSQQKGTDSLWHNVITPFKGGHGVGIASDSSTYGGDDLSMVCWAWAAIGSLNPVSMSPSEDGFEYSDSNYRVEGSTYSIIKTTDEKYLAPFAKWILDYANQIMPFAGESGGVLPSFGDASWAQGSHLYMRAFEIAATLLKTSHPDVASKLKKVANQIYIYQCGGLNSCLTDDPGPLMIDFFDETIPLDNEWVPSSMVSMRHQLRGVVAPDKLILRGKATPNTRGKQPFVMLNCMQTGGHGHADVTNLIAWGVKNQVGLRLPGYDSTPDVLNNAFLLRPSWSPFLNYTQYKDSTWQFSPILPFCWSCWDIWSDQRNIIDAEVMEFDRVAYGKITENYMTRSSQPVNLNGYNSRLFKHTREVALDRETGAMFVFDTVYGLDTIPGTPFQFGQLWQISEVLKNLTNGVIAQDGDYFYINPWSRPANGNGGKSVPYLLQMAGPANTKFENKYWRFHGGMSGDWSQIYHVHTYNTIPVVKNKKISFLSAFYPLSTNASVAHLPKIVTEVNGATGLVKYDDVTIYFGKQTPKSFKVVTNFAFQVGSYKASIQGEPAGGFG